MNTSTMNYYERELSTIDFTGDHSAHVIFGSEGKVTKALAVNHESARAIIAKLIEVFCTGLPVPLPPPAPAVESADTHNTRFFYLFKTDKDINGNKLLKVKCQGKGFTIQTNGNLPKTHSQGLGGWTSGELAYYVRTCGTVRQRKLLGL